MGIPAVSGDDAIRAIVTRNNRAATAEHRPPLQRPFGNVDALSESDIRAVEGAYGYELARPPSAGLMPMSAVFLAQAREAESRGGGDIMTVLRGFQRDGAPINDALLAAVADRAARQSEQARDYLRSHPTRSYYA